MSIPDHVRLKTKINSFIKRAKSGVYDDDVVGMQSKFLCILIAAYLDKAALHIFREYIKSNSHTNEVADFFSRRLFNRGLRNMDFNKIEALLNDFSDVRSNSFRSCMEREIEEHSIDEKINSAVRARNKLAHGDEHPVTILQVEDWLKAIDRLLHCLSNALSVHT